MIKSNTSTTLHFTITNTYKLMRPRTWRRFERALIAGKLSRDTNILDDCVECGDNACCMNYCGSFGMAFCARCEASNTFIQNWSRVSIVCDCCPNGDKITSYIEINMSKLPYFTNVKRLGYPICALVREALCEIPNELVQWTLALWFQSELENFYPQINRVI